MIKVFIVEDDPMVLEVNTGFLKKIPYTQFSGFAKSGNEAITLIKKTKPDLVLLDMFLPDISGFEVLKNIREMEIPTDVIMITAARDTKTIHEVLRLGAVDYIVKPFRFERFKAAIETYEKMWKKFQDVSDLKQEDIDEMKQIITEEEYLPKGLSEKTMKQILMALIEQVEPITADSLAAELGMARVTVRRYLDYLVQKGKVQFHIQYGSVGRPSHFYYCQEN
jgi:two-component system, CitB family, response regulator DctR